MRQPYIAFSEGLISTSESLIEPLWSLIVPYAALCSPILPYVYFQRDPSEKPAS